MRALAQALIATTRGKPFADQATIPLSRDYYSPTRRDLAAQRYLAAKQAQRDGQAARTRLLAAKALCTAAAYALAFCTPTAAGLLFLLAGTCGTITLCIPAPRAADSY